MLKKFGMVTVGVTAGLLAVAPMASASSDHHHERGDGNFNNSCSSEAGDIENDATGEGLVGIGQVAGPVASGSNANVLNCTNFLNDNNVAVGVLGDAVAGDED